MGKLVNLQDFKAKKELDSFLTFLDDIEKDEDLYSPFDYGEYELHSKLYGNYEIYFNSIEDNEVIEVDFINKRKL